MMKAMLRAAAMVAAALSWDGALQAGEVVRLGGSPVKWPASAGDATTEITYATLTGHFSLPSGKITLSPENCGAMGPFADILAASPDVTALGAKHELQSAFAAWEAVANVRFVEVHDLAQANIIVGSTLGAAGRAFANLSLGGVPASRSVAKALGSSGGSSGAPSGGSSVGGSGGAGGTRPTSGNTGDGRAVSIEQAYVCANPRMSWKTGFDGNLDVYDLRYTFMHEIGHAIGLDHPGSTGSIMGFRYDERVRELQPSDIASVQGLYGPPDRK